MAAASDEAKKAELEALVNAGKLSEEEAIAIAEKLGLMQAPNITRTTSMSKATQVYNFSVLKWSKGGSVQRLILQFDFQSLTLSSVQHGTRTKKIEFSSIVSYQSEDGLKLTIKFANQPEYELDADTQEDKNKMCRVLQAVIRNYKHAPMEEQDPYNRSSLVEDVEATREERSQSPGFVDEMQEETPVSRSANGLPGIEPVLSITPSIPIKEGMVEKRGHSAKFLMFSKRWLRVFEGELSYFKPDDLENALNIVPLTPGVTDVIGVGSNQIVVSLSGNDKKFNFRTAPVGYKTAEHVREEWLEAIRKGMNSKPTTVGFHQRTLTAKDMAPSRKHTIKRHFKKQPSADIYVDPFEKEETQREVHREAQREAQREVNREAPREVPREAPKEDVSVNSSSPNTRHWSISHLKTKFRKSNSFHVSLREPRGDGSSPRRRDRSITTSTFYDDDNMAVTKSVSEPADFLPLDLKGKNMNELLVVLKPEFEALSDTLAGMTTGSSKVDMMVVRMSSIINALQNSYTDVTGEELSEPIPEEELTKRLSVVNESSGASSAITSPVKSVGSSNRGSMAGSEQAVVESPEVPSRESTFSPAHSNASSTSIKLSGSLSPSGDNASQTLSPTRTQDPLAQDDDAVTSPSHSDPPSFPGSPPHEAPVAPPIPPEFPSVSENLPPGAPPPPPPPPGAPLPPGVPPPPGAPPPPPGAPPLPPGAPPPPGGPPPPPGLPGILGGLSSILPPRKLVPPGVKMKRFYWNPLPPQQVMKCGWFDWSETDYVDSLDLKSLEEQFGMQENKQKPEMPIKKKPEMKTLLDTTRSRNIEIFLPSFSLPLDDLESKLPDQLNSLKDSELGIDHVVALKRYQPTEEEKEMYKNYKEDRSLLQQADIFLTKLCNIPMLSTRLDLLFTIKEFPANFEGFQPTLNLAWKSTEELKNSKAFIDVLKYILAIGNYLNFGTRQGGAYGYKLSVLPKLSECLGQDKKVTLMHYLLQQLHKKSPELLELPSELESVSKSSEISIMGISAELEVMQKELDKIERFANKIVEQSGLSKAAADKLSREAKEFTGVYREKLADLNVKGIEMSENYREILSQFGEPLSTDSEDFFADIAKFLAHFKRIRTELFPPPKPPKTPTLKHEPKVQPSAVEMPSIKSPDIGKDSEKMVSPSLPASNSKPTLAPPKSTLLSASTAKDPAVNPFRRNLGGSTRHLQPKEGTLEKKTSNGKRWQKRYFELERGQLHYYEAKGQKYSDTIKLREVPIEIDPSDPKVLIIRAETRDFNIRAESAEAASAWFSALKAHAA